MRVEIKYPNELAKPKEFDDDTLAHLMDNGYATEQKINGETFIKMTTKYFEELGEFIKENPEKLCKDYWRKIVQMTEGYDIITFIKLFCITHSFIKEITDGEVDFCEEIEREL